MTNSSDVVIWDTTAPRHLGAVGRHDILITATGMNVPRVVLDPADPTGEALLGHSVDGLSEIAAAEGWFRRSFRRSPNEADFQAAENLAKLRQDPEVRVVDFEADELDDATTFGSEAFANRMGLLAPLGKGEAAVLAVAANREWRAGLDEAAARGVADQLGIPTVTTQQWLTEQVATLSLGKREAQRVYEQMRRGGFRGPPDLWDT